MGNTFYVATDGDDAWSGKLAEPNETKTDGPLASLQRAIEATRAAGTAMPRRIVVGSGTYYGVAVKLDDRDSGLRACFESFGTCNTLRGWTEKHTRVTSQI